jgi:hypothetical protein
VSVVWAITPLLVSCRLEGIDAAEVAGVFSEAEIDLCVLPHLNDNDLQVIGLARLSLCPHSPCKGT